VSPAGPTGPAPKDIAVRPPLEIRQGDNLPILRSLPAQSADLIYIDPPFNTGKTQTQRAGSFDDTFDDFLAFLTPRLEESRRLLTDSGSLFLHLDSRESHYCKVRLDEIFGRGSFMNEIIWAYDYGGRPKRWWPKKHDTLLWYTRHPAPTGGSTPTADGPTRYTFNFAAMDRIPYMAPGLVGPEKAARGKTPTDVWWHTIVPTTSKERTGYPTQKPLGILDRIVRVHTRPGDHVLDFFAGSGTTGEAVTRAGEGRTCMLIDINPEAVAVMRSRLADAPDRSRPPAP